MNAKELAAKLNAYKGDFNDLWFHVIRQIDEYDDAATEAEDPGNAGDVVVLTNGGAVWFDHQRHMWVVSVSA